MLCHYDSAFICEKPDMGPWEAGRLGKAIAREAMEVNRQVYCTWADSNSTWWGGGRGKGLHYALWSNPTCTSRCVCVCVFSLHRISLHWRWYDSVWKFYFIMAHSDTQVTTECFNRQATNIYVWTNPMSWSWCYLNFQYFRFILPTCFFIWHWTLQVLRKNYSCQKISVSVVSCVLQHYCLAYRNALQIS